MGKKHFRKFFAVFMIVFMLFWSALPSISMAFFITPGNAITPGQPIAPGQPITGGQFIVPGQVIQPGNSVNGGSASQGGTVLQGGNSAVSGQPIIPSLSRGNGQFIIPNIAGTLPINRLVTGSPITAGSNVTGGNATEGGKGPSGGNAITGGDTNSTGEAVTGGKATEGGEGPSGGKAAEGGESPSGGNVPTGDSLTGGDSTKGGEGPNGGQNPSGGEGPNGGQNPSGGEGPNGGQNPTGGEGPNEGQNPTGGEGSTGGENPTGDTSNGEAGDSGGNTKTPSLLNIFLNSTTEENGIWGTISQTLKDAKTYATSFVKPVLEGAAATYAGFKFEKLESGNYKVRGKSSLKNPVLNHFYNNYKKYKIDGKERYMPAGKSNQKPFKVSSFFDSKKLAQTKKDILGTTWKNLKSGLNDGYNVFSKKFWAKSNLSKLNGPLSIAATLFGNVDKHGANAFKSSKFYADVTVDLAIGAGTTVASSVISSAVTGAMAGSVVPGVGTIVGAGVGLAVGLGSAWFMNGTSTGRKAKEWISNKVSEGYSFAADLVSKGASKLADKAQGLFNGAKKLFGFG